MPTNTPTVASLIAQYQAEAQNADARLTDWSIGSVNRAHAVGAAALADEVIGVAVSRAEASFVDLARGTDLDARIADYGGSARKVAVAAVAPVTITRGAYVGAYTLTAGTEVVGFAVDGRRVAFTIDANIVLAAPASEASGTMTCSFTGVDGNVPPGTVETVTLPDGLTFSQDERAAGGDDGEPYTEAGDEAYRARFKLELLARERGTVEAIKSAALSVPGIRYATVDESTAAGDDGGFVSVYIGDPNAEANSTLLDAALAAIDDVRAAGIEVQVFSAERQEEAFEFNVYVPAGSPLVAADAQQAFIDWLNGEGGALGFPVGETYTDSRGQQAIHRALDPLDNGAVRLVIQTNPPGNLLAPDNPYSAIRTNPDGSNVVVTMIYG